jgi:hypothetical protein
MAIKKIAYNINAFDGSELINPALEQIRDQIDWITAIYQKKSYWGNPMDPEDFEELQRLKSIGLIDEIIEFVPDFSKYSREQECEKRNFGINLMRERGYSHVMSVDADELYSSEQFKYAKDQINKKGWPITYCSYVNYFRDLEHYLVYPFRPGVPFIHSTFFNYTYNSGCVMPSDPTRRINNPTNIGTKVFDDSEIRMIHLAWVRKNIRKKLENWSAKNFFDKSLVDAAVERYENYKEGDDAKLLFNVPGNSVNVRKLNTRMTSIKIEWVENRMNEWKTKNGYL